MYHYTDFGPGSVPLDEYGDVNECVKVEIVIFSYNWTNLIVNLIVWTFFNG